MKECFGFLSFEISSEFVHLIGWCGAIVFQQEKYGPKGQGKVSNGTPGKQNNKDSKQQQLDFDIKIGLSKRPPWFCRYIILMLSSDHHILYLEAH